MTIPDHLAAALTDRYAIDRDLGAGGMATEYLARELKHDRLVAIKVRKPELAAVIGDELCLSDIETTANLRSPTARSNSPSTTRCVSRAKWPTGGRTRTNAASSIATSSPRTGCCRVGTHWSSTRRVRLLSSRGSAPTARGTH